MHETENLLSFNLNSVFPAASIVPLCIKRGARNRLLGEESWLVALFCLSIGQSQMGVIYHSKLNVICHCGATDNVITP